jgi:mannan endo-1,4-beta-mannosidase
MLAPVLFAVSESDPPFEVSSMPIAALSSFGPPTVAISLYSFLCSNFLKRTLSGTSSDSAQIHNVSGHLPAILALDPTSPSVVSITATHWTRGGIPALIWRWSSPPGVNLSQAIISGTSDYSAIVHEVDTIAATLIELRTRKVAVLFRPFPPLADGFGWWRSAGPSVAVELYRIVFERLLNHHHLTNLIWV